MELINRTEDKAGMDPYKVLGVTPQTSDDDVKRAYRELARKYHPDNYVGSPLADLAETRMKEINEAYDMIMNARAGGGNSTSNAGTSSQTAVLMVPYVQWVQCTDSGCDQQGQPLFGRRNVAAQPQPQRRMVFPHGYRLFPQGLV